MFGWLFGSRERRPRSRLAGCLVWIVALIALLILLSLLFGGFRKGTKAAGYRGRPGTWLVLAGCDHGRLRTSRSCASTHSFTTIAEPSEISLFSTFPREFFGSSSRNSMTRGYL